MLFVEPQIISICLKDRTFVKAQATGTPSNPNFDCGAVSCVGGKFDTADLTVSWNDNPGSDVNGYIVRMIIEGGIFDINDEDASGGESGCDIVESPAGTYTLTCLGLLLSEGGGCSCPADFELDSITDPDGNELPVNGLSCENSDEC
jgi:hypothetical protein